MTPADRDSYALRLEQNELLWEILNEMGGRCWRNFEHASTPQELAEIHAQYKGVKTLVQQLKDAISSARATQAKQEKALQDKLDPGHAA